jgi:hypothetical protein
VLDESMGRRWGNYYHMPRPEKNDGPAEVSTEQPIIPQSLAAVQPCKRVQSGVPPETDRSFAYPRFEGDPAESAQSDARGEKGPLHVKIVPFDGVPGHHEEEAKTQDAWKHEGDSQPEEMREPGGSRDGKISSGPRRQDQNRSQRRYQFETLGPWGGRKVYAHRFLHDQWHLTNLTTPLGGEYPEVPTVRSIASGEEIRVSGTRVPL